MKILEWPMIILVLVGVAIVSGLLFGSLGDFVGLSPSLKTVGMGASVGIVGAVLLSRRRAAINAQKNR